MKICKKCNLIKPLTDFHKKGNDNYRAECRLCYNNNWKYRLMSNISSRKCNQKLLDGRNKKIHYIEKGINGAFLESLKIKQNGMCYWLNIPIDFTLKDKLRKPSIDRLDNNIGYTKDNIVLTTIFANTGRRDATILEMSNFVTNYL